ncbi:leucine carboxyl methyltransferase, putative [Plasmodium yoelii]|uniref:Leucine carboxyl methyltransferase 1 n=3 Tax=Plasmodium yoelii TaxID=5861 RepID=A0AAE9WTC7_PLAYO|nr:leucine carboxyl methyltransferase, putative [Plasmodium yoelii]WBY59726.1 leucine carboxyl methyltransferase [Plasmodium yoelii yoelii]CDU19695.1 leucine carboxyl methyltransferase, putative [Plasmodium yoelii]VTZ80452.1 leucine carboxyl methyltransferase, putative [Plasmodium yoelii]|eukprot:XP_022813491.1 leucine carboxyl methyltransferase, putative [Plasmodium yoelii]
MDCAESSNRNVQGTTYEAASSKLSAIQLGYYHDPYMQYFVKRRERRSPLINRGYYSRVAAIRQYIEMFVKSLGNDELVQVVNIGAGLDTMFFWIYEQYKNIKYYEMDFYELLNEKKNIINNVELLNKFLISNDKCVQNEKDLINCENYKMVSFDLNDANSMEQKLTNSGFDFSLPTVFLCECVLIYLEVESSDNLIKTLSELMKNTACIVVYEQVNPNTAFGAIMIDNFNQRGISLKSIYKYNSLELQMERYKRLGWSNVYINDMNEIYDYHINSEEKKKIEKIEMFDEFEEWRLLQNHYFILVAFNCHKNIHSNKLKQFLENKKTKGG